MNKSSIVEQWINFVHLDNIILLVISCYVVGACICRVSLIGRLYKVSWAYTYALIGMFAISACTYIISKPDVSIFDYDYITSALGIVCSAFHIMSTRSLWDKKPPAYMKKDWNLKLSEEAISYYLTHYKGKDNE